MSQPNVNNAAANPGTTEPTVSPSPHQTPLAEGGTATEEPRGAHRGASGLANYWHVLAGHVRFLISSLSKKNYKAHLTELSQLESSCEPDLVELFVLQCLVGQIDWNDTKRTKDQFKLQLLAQKMNQISNRPNFSYLINTALEEIKSVPEGFISTFCRILKLSLGNEMAVALSLAKSHNENLRRQGIKHLQQRLVTLSTSNSSNDKIPEFIFQHLLLFLHEDGGVNFPKKSVLLEGFKKLYGNALPALPLLEPKPTRDDGKDWKKEVKVSASFLETVDKSFTPAEIMEDLGCICCKSKANLKKVFTQSSQLTPQAIAEIIGMMISTSRERPDEHNDSSSTPETSDTNNETKAWNISIFCSVIKEMCPTMNFTSVIEELDYGDFKIYDQKGVELVLEVFQKLSKDPFPIEIFFKRWENPEAQWSFLKHLIQIPDNNLILPSTLLLNAVEGIPVNAPLKPNNQHFYSIPFLSILMDLTTESLALYTEINGILQEGPVKNFPGVLLVGLAFLNKTDCALKKDLVDQLITLFLPANNYHNSNTILYRLWNIDKALVIDGMINIYKIDPAFLSRALTISQELKELRTILDAHPLSDFSIDLAALAFLREHLNLSKWVEEMVHRHGESFCLAVLNFLKNRIKKQENRLSSPNGELGNVQTDDNKPSAFVILSPEAIQVFVDALRSAPMSATIQEEFKQLIKSDDLFPKDIEDEADAYFRKIYSGEMSMEEIIKKLLAFKTSPDLHEQRVFQCMTRSLFDEYKFYSKYPEKELKISGVLFGNLIQHGLLSNQIPLGIALRYVLEALYKPPNSNLFKFGIYALEKFAPRLHEWSLYCQHLLQIPSLKNYPQLFRHIRSCAQLPEEVPEEYEIYENDEDLEQEANMHHSEMFLGPPSVSDKASFQFNGMEKEREKIFQKEPIPEPTTRFNPAPKYVEAPKTVSYEEKGISSHAYSINTLLKNQIRVLEPTEDVLDKLKFILNNVSSQNMESKVMELKSILLVDYFDFFAQYIVTNRIATQENFHELYLDLILRLKNKDLERKVLKQSCNAVKALMGSEKIRVEIQERVLLKNLGNWIGLFTISRDIPLLHKDLSLKDILFQGYEEGKMIASVPFVSKVLGKGMISRFFKPPNPWVVSICRLLVEIYNLPNIKIFLKFDVEILHTTLNLNMAETVPTQLLKSRRVCMVPPIVDFDELPVDTQPKRSMFDNITFNPNIPFFNTPNFKKIVVHSISKAIQDNITYLIDNPVSVSSTTTKELILKDFAMEPDETKILRAASSMAQGLAAHLSGSAARDILRNAITQKIRIALTNNTRQPLPSYVEHAILTFVSENLELVCSVVQKAAVEASVQAVEQQLRQAIVDRKNHRERTGGRGQPYYDINFVGSSAYNIIMTLPESLRPRVVQPKQLQVYEEFFPGTRVKEQGNIGPSIATNPEKESGKSRATITQVPQNQELSLDQATSIIEKVVNDLVSLTNDSQGKPISPTDPTVGKIFSTIDPIMASPVRFDVAQYGVVLALVKIIDPLLCDVFIELLVNVVSVIPKMRVKITNLLTTTFAKNKQYQKTVPTLILCNIIDLPEYDVFLARNHVTINSEREDVEFLSTLLPTITAKFGSTQLMSSFSVTLREIKNISQSNNHVNTLFKFLKKNIKDLSFDGGLCYKAVQPTLQQKIVQLFNEWMTVYEKIDSPEKSYIQYIQQQKGFYGLKDFPNNENEFNYFRVTIEIALERCFKEEPEVKPNEDPTTEDKGPRLNYKPIDALSKLLSLIVKYFPEKVLILKRILYVIAGILERNYYNQPEQFDQRPYFRLFSNLLMEFNLPDPVFESNIRHILLEFQALFHKFRPSLFPGFSFAWLELISHRTFMPRLLKDSSQEGWVPMQELLLDLLQFLEPYLRSVQLNPSIRMLYKGTLRIFLVILHDFPQFFCEYHFHFCNVIPNSCIQLRNLVLSAFPRSMKLPDPLTPNLKVDLLPEIRDTPRIRSYLEPLFLSSLKLKMDLYIKNPREHPNFLSELLQNLKYSSPEEIERNSTKFNIPLFHSLVLAAGPSVIPESSPTSSPSPPHSSSLPPMEIFKYLCLNLEPEGRYYLLNSIANQLRYPNSHTYYYSCVMLYLFAEAPSEIIQEQITRVLVERLVPHRPHPWGLLITFIELMKNNRSFPKCAPEIERLFLHVGKSIAQTTQQ